MNVEQLVWFWNHCVGNELEDLSQKN
jgi:hypothetical protein